MPTHRTAASTLVLAILSLAVLAGCTGWNDTNESRTRDAAELLGYRLVNSGVVTTRELAGVADGRGATVMVADDIPTGSRLVVRLSETEELRNGGTRTWTACWEYTFVNLVEDHVPHHVACPATPPAVLAPTTTTTQPSLPDDALDRLTAAVAPLTADEWADHRHVEDVVALAFAGADDATIDVGRWEGTTGVAVGAGRTCVMARSKPHESWTVPWQVLRPGEGTCDGISAATGGLKHTPH